MSAPFAFAAWPVVLSDMGLTDWFYQAVKILAVAGGVIVGWLIAPVVVRVLVRLAFHRQTPPTVQTVSRFGGAVLLGFLVYLIPLGPGSGGFGWGGGGNGTGKGEGVSSKDGKGKPRSAKKEIKPDTKRKPSPDVFTIRVLGGKAVDGDRFYQIKVDGKDKAVNDVELRKVLERERKRLRRIRIERTDESTDDRRVLNDLVELCKEYVLSVETVNKE
jgi:hypothetical protein